MRMQFRNSAFAVERLWYTKYLQNAVCYTKQFKLLLTLQDNPGVVTCMDNQPHGLQTGQSVVFREVNGMVELNSSVRPVSGIMSTLEPITLHTFMFLKSFDNMIITVNVTPACLSSDRLTTKTLFIPYCVCYFSHIFLTILRADLIKCLL